MGYWLLARIRARVPAMGMAHFRPFGAPSLPVENAVNSLRSTAVGSLGVAVLRGAFPVSRAVHSGRFCGQRCGVSWVCAVRILARLLVFCRDAPGVSGLSFPLWPAGGSAAVGVRNAGAGCFFP